MVTATAHLYPWDVVGDPATPFHRWRPRQDTQKHSDRSRSRSASQSAPSAFSWWPPWPRPDALTSDNPFPYTMTCS